MADLSFNKIDINQNQKKLLRYYRRSRPFKSISELRYGFERPTAPIINDKTDDYKDNNIIVILFNKISKCCF